MSKAVLQRQLRRAHWKVPFAFAWPPRVWPPRVWPLPLSAASEPPNESLVYVT